MNVKQLPLSFFVDNLKNGQPFTFARYGDGEWLTILGFYGMHNSNGCTFTKALSDDMRAVLSRQNDYHHAILKIARRERDVPYKGREHPYGGSVIDKWLKGNDVKLDWYNGDILLDESLEGNLFPLVEQIRERRVLYVGNHRLKNLNMRSHGFFSFVAYIEPEPRDAHEDIEDLLKGVYKSINKNNIDFVGWSSGLAAKVMIDEVYMRFPEVTQIDFGSMFDGYFRPMPNVLPGGSRSYIRKGKHNFDELLRKNTGIE